ncbi:hypothetical protein PCASD_25313, partial [Puccinia coronata f. sp. avenae]
MKSQINVQVLILLLAGMFSEILAQCFITGTQPIPAIVGYNRNIRCETFNGRPQFPKVPDVFTFINGGRVRFSDILFPRNRGALAPQVYAVMNYSLLPLNTVLGYLDLYAATSAGLRSQGNTQAVNILKGAQFFLELQARLLAVPPAAPATPPELSNLYAK